MAGRGRPGSAPQTEKREQFARLIAQGVSSSQACRIVGVNRRTGKRWRHGRTITSSTGKRRHYPPVINVGKREISSRYLSEDERVCIADLDRASRGVREIAAEIGRSASTINRELRRNRDPGSGQYRPFTAQRLAVERRPRPRRGKLIRVWVPNWSSTSCDLAYSCINPPSRSRRRRRSWDGDAGGGSDLSGDAWCRARCGRWSLKCATYSVSTA
ncbi:MAG: helix-turn-helix domain-containing protein, partial [Pseudonocardiales bacterium]|nr:helix-turn-helix domain-containing protein [Pseudonocardiales bacterium]